MKHSKASIFLMELIIAILFFSLAGAVCIQMYVKADSLRQRTTNTNESIVHLQAIAECFVARNGDLRSVSDMIDGAFLYDDNTLVVCYDKEWHEIGTPSEAVFASILALKSNEGISPHPDGQTSLLEANICTVKLSPSEMNLDVIIDAIHSNDSAAIDGNIIMKTPLRKHLPLSVG